MATILTEALSPLSFARNPLVVTFYNDEIAPSERTESVSVEIEVWVELVYNSGTFTKISEFCNPYNMSSEEAKFNISRSLLSCFNPSLPPVNNSTLTPITGIVKKFKILARDVVGGIPEESFTQTAVFHALMGGTNKSTGELPLSDKPYILLMKRSSQRRIHINELLHLEFLPLESGTPTLEITWTTATTSGVTEIILPAVTQYEPQSINVNLLDRSLIKTMTIRILGFTLPSLETISMIQVSYEKESMRTLIYRNSLGGMETIAMIGINEIKSTTKSDLFETEEAQTFSTSEGNSFAFNQSITQSYLFRTGFLSYYDKIMLFDMPLRNEAYLLWGEEFRKLYIQPGTFLYSRDKEDLHQAEFQARLAYDDHSI